MDEELPIISTPTDLPAEATETKCEIKSGEVVLLMANGRAKMPDGTIRQSLKDCKFQNGSSFMLYHGDETNKMTAVKVSKPRQKTFPAVVVPSTPTPVYDDTIPIVSIPQSQDSRQTNVNTGIDPVFAGIVATAVVASVAVSSIASSAKARKLKRMERLTQQNNKRKEEQSKCNSKSDNVKTLVAMTEEMIDTSPVNSLAVKPSKEFLDKVNDLNSDLKNLNKDLRNLEDKITIKK